jgi:hypothetical protein
MTEQICYAKFATLHVKNVMVEVQLIVHNALRLPL